MSDVKMYTFEIIKRNKNSPGGLGLVRYTCTAPNQEAARLHFEEQFGVGDTVAGPNLVKEQ